MSGIVIGSTAAALTTIAAVMVATFPDAAQAVAPFFEVDHEYAAFSAALVTAIPFLAVLTVLAGSARD